TRALHVARDAEDARARVIGRADLGVLRAAVLRDELHVAERLDVVDDRRALVEAEDGGEIRGLDARVGALALEGLDETGLLAADVGAGAAVHEDVAGVRGAGNVLADKTSRAGLGEGLLKDARTVRHLAADVDVGLL